jgi:hypothetical protein
MLFRHAAIDRLRSTLFLVVMAGSLVLSGFGQEVRGTITGTVTDPQGAAIADAKVTVKSLDTNVEYPATTNAAGLYVVPLLSPGNYSVSVTKEGFSRSQEPNLMLTANQRLDQDFHLQIGSVNQQVIVTAEAPQLDTESASREQIVSEQAVANTPLEGRNSFMLATLTAGVFSTSIDSLNSIRPFDNGGMDNMQINGGLSYRNNFTINGVPDTNSEGNGNPGELTFVPPPDAVKEVNVETSAYDAQFGHTGGGNVNVDLKSGSNRFHGAAYDYVRNTIFNANRWENNANGSPRPAYHWQEPGVELDGPLYIPKVYDGRNKTFFMFSWERIKDAIPQPLTSSVPTAAERAGNFAGSGFTIYDPCNTTLTATAPCTNNGSRTPFAGDVIPASRLNPVGVNLLNSYPLPTSGTQLNNFFFGSSEVSDLYDAFTYTVDQTLNSKNHLSFAYFQGDRHQVEPTYGYPTAAASPLYLHYRINHGGSADWTSTINPSTVLDVRFGFERHNFAVNPYSIGYNDSNLGFPSSFTSQLAFQAFPTVNVTQTNGGSTLGTLGTTRSGGAGSGTKTNTSAVQGTLTKIIGSHSVKVGSQFNVVLNNFGAPAAPTFNFDSTFTQANPLVAVSGQGNGFADMALGYPTSGSVPIPGFFAYSSHYYAVFVQDDWKVNSRLSLNLGLRWDVETPLTERYNRLNSGFAFDSLSPVQPANFGPVYGGLTFVNSSNRSAYVTDYNNIQPRIGAAYKLRDTTVLRGGFGIYYLPTFDIPGTQGFSTTSNYTASINGNVTPANSLNNPFPGGIVQPTGSSLGLGTLLGQSVTSPYTGRAIPRNYQFSFGVQQQLPKNFMFEASYAGSRTHELETNVNIDTISPQLIAEYGSQLNAAVPNPFQGLLPGTNLNGATITRLQSLLPYPQFLASGNVSGVSLTSTAGLATENGGVIEQYIPIGHTWYNALQIRLEKRFSQGLYFLTSYTFSKSMQAMSFLNGQDATGGTGQLLPNAASHLLSQLTTTDVPQVLRISGGYELPFFKHSNKWLHGPFGGWQVNAVLNYISGTPIPAPVGAYSTGINPSVPNPNSNLYFNNCYITLSGALSSSCVNGLKPAWIQQPTYSLNELTPVMPNIRLSRPPLADMSIFKSFPIHERLTFQLRGEAFNVTNTVWFPAPNTSLTSPFFGKTVLATGGFSSTSNDPRSIQISARIQF